MVRLIETKHDIFVMYECNKYQRCFYLDVTCKNIAFRVLLIQLGMVERVMKQ